MRRWIVADVMTEKVVSVMASATHKEIRDEVLLRTLWIDPEKAGVDVADGVVRLTGTVDRKSTADIIVRTCPGVAGVVDVVDQIVPDRDDTAELNRHNLMGATVKVLAP
jgi:osmotically-inducible protein OsmY